MPPVIVTERLRLRPFTLEDTEAAYEVFEGHPDVWRYDPGYARSYEQRARLIQKYAATNELDGVGTLAVTLLEDGTPDGGKLIGYVGLQYYILPRLPYSTPEIELYYKLGRAYWGKGYATEAGRSLIEYAFDFLRLHRLVSVADPKNRESVRLLERLGFRIEPAPGHWVGDVIGTLENDRPPIRWQMQSNS